MHMAADAFTRVLAIIALVAGRFLRVEWTDAAKGIVTVEAQRCDAKHASLVALSEGPSR